MPAFPQYMNLTLRDQPIVFQLRICFFSFLDVLGATAFSPVKSDINGNISVSFLILHCQSMLFQDAFFTKVSEFSVTINISYQRLCYI